MIKRCPLCGSKGFPVKILDKWGVSCINEQCKCAVNAEFNTKIDAIRAWNKRNSLSYNLNPEVVMNYLENAGWEKISADGNHAVFTIEDGLVTVSVPLRIGASINNTSFEKDMEEVITAVSDYEFVFPEEIIDALEDEYVYCTECGYCKIINEEPKCLCEEKCYFWDPEDSAPRSLRTKYIEPELGNILFGNSRGEYSVNRELIEPIFWDCFGRYFDAYMYFKGDDEHITDRGGYENDVFKVNPYYWGDEDKIADEPNFVYKPENIEIFWYKYPFRDSYSNINITAAKASEIFSKCQNSIEKVRD